MTKLLYIGGYGHSGSTLFEYLMAGSPVVLACGEVVSVIRERAGKRKYKKCSCGFGKTQCPVWSFFHSSDEYRRLTHAELLKAIMQNAGAQYAAIVDSSKTAWGMFGAPFKLRFHFGSEFVLLHLTRHPTAVCWSVLKKKNRQYRKRGHIPHHYALRCGSTILAWSLANLSCEIFRLFYPHQYVRLRYEDLVRSPAKSLNGLFDRILPDVRWRYPKAGAHQNRHQLHGNSIRYYQLTIEDVKEDLKWRSEMPREYARVVLALSYLLRLRYDYVREPERVRPSASAE